MAPRGRPRQSTGMKRKTPSTSSDDGGQRGETKTIYNNTRSCESRRRGSASRNFGGRTTSGRSDSSTQTTIIQRADQSTQTCPSTEIARDLKRCFVKLETMSQVSPDSSRRHPLVSKCTINLGSDVSVTTTNQITFRDPLERLSCLKNEVDFEE